MRYALTALLFVFSAGATAAESAGATGHESAEEHGRHALALFAGVTREGHENLETLGVEYSYRINRNWTVGGLIERAVREKNSTLAIAWVHLWPYKGLFLGPGVGRKDPVGERENTLRLSIGYEIELGGGWSIAPSANLDIIDGEEDEEVYGVSIGRWF